ncbi:MAG: molybdenum cofactor carrier [Myxococcales bacterium]|mgnify:CR=1 FL=1|nr:molybdenum cofactor carrier [Myxococcales bacterium]
MRKIISGGQTGVDRAALDVALALNFPCGGSCPRGRLAEDGPIPARYPLEELSSRDYAQRTLQNVVDSDATLIITCMEATGGTAFTIRCAESRHRPFLIVDPREEGVASRVVQWLVQHEVDTLNVAGPRASKDETIHHLTFQMLQAVLEQLQMSP